MAKLEAKRAMRQTLLSGYSHHSHSIARQKLFLFLTGQGEADLLGDKGLDVYEDVLAPNRLRAIKNGIICLITVVCRAAIELGVADEQSFSLSDYYINTLEHLSTEQQLSTLTGEMMEHYADLVQAERYRAHSLHITRAIRYISQKLYEPCRVSDVAAHVKLNPQYFSGLFKKELGLEPSVYIRKQKMEEAASLLMQTDTSVASIADALGYCNSSYFANEFRKVFGVTPKQYTSHGKRE